MSGLRRWKRRICSVTRLTNVALTADGSKTVYSRRFEEHYHSKFGAVNESKHVFVEAGYMAVSGGAVSVLEIGFGTGLNALLTLQQAEKMRRCTYYETLELYPIDNATVSELSSDDGALQSLHVVEWEQAIEITPHFVLYKRKSDLLHCTFNRKFDVVYFDAFSPAVQPEMWTFDVFASMYAAMNIGAVLTTYCAKGDVRRTMQSAGFSVERLKGPPAGKREMLRAIKM